MKQLIGCWLSVCEAVDRLLSVKQLIGCLSVCEAVELLSVCEAVDWLLSDCL